MKHLQLRLKKNVLVSILTIIFVMGTVGNASARPMFGSSETCNESTCWAGYKMCQKTTYIFWVGFKSSWEPQACY